VHPVLPAALSVPIEIGFPATKYQSLLCLKKQAISSLDGMALVFAVAFLLIKLVAWLFRKSFISRTQP
jgi:hypothetical protein